MTRDEGAKALEQAWMALRFAAELIKPHMATLDQFEKEDQRAESILPIINPTLYMNPTRIKNDNVFRGPAASAKRFCAEIDTSLEYLQEDEP